MKSKEEILNSYYAHGADGMPEINADSLLKAMEEYRRQAEEAAFNAARLQNNNQPAFVTFADYQASLQAQIKQFPKKDTVQLVADSIVEQFLPDDPTQHTFEFSFKIDGTNHTARYKRNPQGQWEYAGKN
ncbi:hypothetical protein [Mucilaginibacter phyllosphaerae]|uniref:Uncharacterized protein n=1 Tax=Mucilaginibacter phyllosphaerae TaxID=1812349 RepID=A0A4Y8AJ03_9SPHI|nr:hypothetical protein [Mucilaginibacter phyllosphaerae]MBB3967942.1 hypothetical protein [Mucilaginibacter phyllosphaerae]TEW69020.1 hypothetical protein E2R65_02325 [Mucilaginibacter phyllosphaerae]GGH02284.1 hypothetical protein GCM10007352_04430 [Mucilaginibacter phyllosphaerae]